MSQFKEIAIEALEELIIHVEAQLEKMKAKLEAMKNAHSPNTLADVGDPVPPDPTHPQG